MLYSRSCTEEELNRRIYATLVCLWCMVQFYLYHKHGVKVAFDSMRYLAEAQNIDKLNLSELRLSYISYSLFLRFSLELTGNLKSVVALQIITGGVATVAFYRLAMLLYNNHWIAFAATTLLIVWPDFQQWHFYVHTESLFASLIIIVFLRMVTAYTGWHYLQLAFLLCFVAFLRANGFMVGLAVLCYVIVFKSIRKNYKLIRVMGVIAFVLMPLLVLLAHTFLSDMEGVHSFTGHLVSGAVIQGYQPMAIAGGERISLSGAPMQQVLQLLAQEPVFFFRKSLLRIVWYWGQVRPYYSSLHNWLIVLYIYPLYWLMIWNIKQRQTPLPMLLAVLTLFVLFTAMVVVSGVDWDNRFMMPLFPWVILLGTAGGEIIIMKCLGPRLSGVSGYTE